MLNGLLTWIGRGFGINKLTLELIMGYIFYPVTFLMGVPRNEILPVAQLLGTKLIANELVAYTALNTIKKGTNPLSSTRVSPMKNPRTSQTPENLEKSLHDVPRLGRPSSFRFAQAIHSTQRAVRKIPIWTSSTRRSLPHASSQRS
jgi:hypothetical protein